MPMVLEMRRRGIRIDQDAAEQARDLLLANATPRSPSFRHSTARSSAWTKSMVANGRKRPSSNTASTFRARRRAIRSFSAGKSGWMATHQHWLPQGIAIANKYEAAGTKFLEGHILKHIVGGRIYAEIHSFRADEGGTRSSRFSYSNPPLQQMPVRDKELGPMIRSVFLPEEGEIWCKPDQASRSSAGWWLRGQARPARVGRGRRDLPRQSECRFPCHGCRDDRARSRCRQERQCKKRHALMTQTGTSKPSWSMFGS